MATALCGTPKAILCLDGHASQQSLWALVVDVCGLSCAIRHELEICCQGVASAYRILHTSGRRKEPHIC